MDLSFATDADVLGTRDDPLVFEPGTVGWGDGGRHFDVEGGVTLVKVTLFRGRDPTRPLKAGEAQGQRVLCRIGGGLFRIPKPGTGVMVGFPTWFSTMPGAGLIVSTVEPSPDMQFSETRAKLELGPDVDLVIKARSITISDYADRFVHVGPDGGIQVQDADGTGVIIRDGAVAIFAAEGGAIKTLLQLSPNALEAMQASGNVFKLKGGNVTLLGNQCSLACACIALGVGASPATPAHYGPAPVASMPSTTVWIQP
jgi:hypothetical protein